MRYALAFFYLFLLINNGFSQDCPTETVYITNQAELEAFAENYPNCTKFDHPLRVSGLDIISLEKLAFLKELNGGFSVSNTSVTNLQGLEDLESFEVYFAIYENAQLETLSPLKISSTDPDGASIFIGQHPKLTSIDGLQDIQFVPEKSIVNIVDNPLLQICDYDNICQYLNSYDARYTIIGNGEDCKFRESILEECGGYPGQINGEILFADGFENLDDLGSPLGWEINNEIDSSDPDITLVNPLIEGESALWLRSNTPSLQRTIATLKLPAIYSQLDIVFTMKCQGVGTCYLELGQVIANGDPVMDRIWRRPAGDDGVYTIYLSDIKIKDSFDGYATIELGAEPIYTPIDIYGISEFTIDDLKIYANGELVNIEVVNESPFSLFPNPTVDRLSIEVANKAIYSSIDIFNGNGTLLRKIKFTNSLDVSDLPRGMYIIQLSGAQEVITQPFVKM